MRAATRLPLRPPLLRAATRTPPSRRFISSTHPASKSRSWSSSAVRWGIAVGGVWWYTTTYGFNAYAESTYQQNRHADSQDTHGEADLPTIDDIATARRQRRLAESAPLAAVAAAEPNAAPSTVPLTGAPGGAAPLIPDDAQQQSPPPPGMAGGGGIGDLEEEAEGQGAFNEETGEINWDCPCLGGMAYGPCGPEFREAFSCFVFSQEDPKGIDCIDRFKGMQDCFRLHPDVYGAELADDGIDDDDYEATQNATRNDTVPTGSSSSPSIASGASSAPPTDSIGGASVQDSKAQPPQQQRQQPLADAEKDMPKQWHDTTSENQSSSSPSSSSSSSEAKPGKPGKGSSQSDKKSQQN